METGGGVDLPQVGAEGGCPLFIFSSAPARTVDVLDLGPRCGFDWGIKQNKTGWRFIVNYLNIYGAVCPVP